MAGAVFTSGARSNEEKPRYDLVPLCAVRREAVRFAEGAKDHGERNYQKGAGDPAFARDRLNHLIEHALKYAEGDRGDDHLGAIRANAAILCWLEQAEKPSVGLSPEPEPVCVGQHGWTVPRRMGGCE